MNHSVINASVTMNGLQRKLDMIAGNLANLNTAGYKRQDATFEDLLTTIKEQRGKQLPGRLSPPTLPIGSGARLVNLRLDMSQGTLQKTDNPLDLALEGNGLFEIGFPVVNEDGEVVYESAWTRNGAFRLANIQEDGENFMLTTAEGYPVLDRDGERILVPTGSTITVDQQGDVYVRTPGSEEAEYLATLKIVRINRIEYLEARGDNLFALSGALTDPADRAAVVEELDLSAEGSGVTVRSGFLEGSNVDMITEMTELIQVQRAYQLNARALASADQMMNIANRLRG